MLPGIAVARPGPARFIFDDRFAQARALARAVRRQGMAAIGFSGDLTRLWREQLRTCAGPIMGVTTPRAMFCLEQLSADHGWRIRERDLRAADGTLVAWELAPRHRPEIEA